MTDAAHQDPPLQCPPGAPLVSVVVPHYDRPLRLIDTLNSIKSQTFTDWEAIIVDDASPRDPSQVLAPLLEDKRFRLVRLERNSGPSTARNVGIEHSRGRFVAFLDSDDLWEVGKLASQVDAILQSPEPDLVICTTQILKLGPDDHREVAPMRAAAAGEDFGRYALVDGGLTQTSAVMLSRQAAQRIGFEPTLRQFEDYLFFIKAGALGLEHRLVAEPLAVWFNDRRPDRLSKSSHNNIDNLRQFLALADPLLSRETRLCFVTRHAGVVHLRSAPVRGLLDLAHSISAGFITWRFAGSIAANALSPPWLTRLRRRLKGWRAATPPDLAKPSTS